MKRFTMSDMPIVIDIAEVEMRAVEAGEMTLTRLRLPRSTNLQTIVCGLPGGGCPSTHWGYVISGHIRWNTEDGPMDVMAGEMFHVRPGHTLEVVEDSEFVEVSHTATASELHEHIRGRIEGAIGEID
jgi:quercetin dioxygenase-like cupin family protein